MLVRSECSVLVHVLKLVLYYLRILVLSLILLGIIIILLLLLWYKALLTIIRFGHVSCCLYIEIRFFIRNIILNRLLLYILILTILEMAILLHGNLVVHEILLLLPLKKGVIYELLILHYVILNELIVLIRHHLRWCYSLVLLVILEHYVWRSLHL